MTVRKTGASDPAYLIEFRIAVREQIDAIGIKQMDLAAKLGISDKHLCEILSGAVGGGHATIDRIARAVGLRITVVRDQR